MSRPQFSMKLLLVAILVAAAFFGGMAVQRKVAGIQATAREIELENILRETKKELVYSLDEKNRLMQFLEEKDAEGSGRPGR